MKSFLLLCCLALLATLAGCHSSTDSQVEPDRGKSEAQVEPEARATAAGNAAPPNPVPPAPPILEDFEGKPRLSLFPRVGDFQPEADDTERIGYWRTFIEHLVRTSGPIAFEEPRNRAFGVRSIKTIDSVAFFSPLAVEPGTTYRVRLDVKTELPEGASAGAGILEFDEFLWVGEQFTESLTENHHIGTHEGVRLTGSRDWETIDFSFTTGDRTAMIHLVLYIDGEAGRQPVLFDNIRVAQAGPQED